MVFITKSQSLPLTSIARLLLECWFSLTSTNIGSPWTSLNVMDGGQVSVVSWHSDFPFSSNKNWYIHLVQALQASNFNNTMAVSDITSICYLVLVVDEVAGQAGAVAMGLSRDLLCLQIVNYYQGWWYTWVQLSECLTSVGLSHANLPSSYLMSEELTNKSHLRNLTKTNVPYFSADGSESCNDKEDVVGVTNE